MNTAIVNVKIDPETKKEAQKVAAELGLSLSGLMRSFIKQLIEEKRVEFSLSEEPSEFLKRAIKRARKDLKAGKASPIFDKAEDAIAWLHRKE